LTLLLNAALLPACTSGIFFTDGLFFPDARGE
jgi:hypothetical protein